MFSTVKCRFGNWVDFFLRIHKITVVFYEAKWAIKLKWTSRSKTWKWKSYQLSIKGFLHCKGKKMEIPFFKSTVSFALDLFPPVWARQESHKMKNTDYKEICTKVILFLKK